MDLFEGIEIAEEIKTAIQTKFETAINEEKKQTTVNINRAMDGISKTVSEITGIERKAEELKITDYFTRIATEMPVFVENKLKTKYESKISDLETKLNAGFKDDTIKKEIEDYKLKLQSLGEKLQLTENENKKIAEDYENKLTGYKLDTEIRLQSPAFDKNQNQYEIEAKKSEALKEIKEKYSFSFDDKNQLVCESKDDYTKKLYKDLISEKMKSYLEKESSFSGAKPPTNQTNQKLNTVGMNDIQKRELFESHLKTSGILKGHPNYGTEMDKLIRKDLGFIN